MKCQYRCDIGEGGVHAIKHILFANGVPLLLFSPDMLVQTFPSVIRIIDLTFFFKKQFIYLAAPVLSYSIQDL